MTKSTTPKFDALVAKFRKAGHTVTVTDNQLGAGSVYSVARGATVNYRCLANVRVIGDIEIVDRNKKFKITDVV